MYAVRGCLFVSRHSIKFVQEERCFNCANLPWESLKEEAKLNRLISDFNLEKHSIGKHVKRYIINTDEKLLEGWFNNLEDANNEQKPFAPS